ncbi:the N-terminal zinc finger domain of cell growth regulating nucleolar protein Lyar [Dimargaris cristalligena]|uniref:The N-terminal zinc finger domain of cell growth regulating nucleolar protein Lyar n=1 Tax=Dimargaris cristalligena TaxID=215637 RepID=A0A4P9ZSF7_9FUNG|nr:the N-terminal zinc finger domain of cell growth regulating nucleolar protein Lyar [Dimargaris cristalligena]|eukprot:RKP35632.1 the N-terminal zinc finger domain of cell growth regulating nucleolar protein Lyar [Dimargaris cristalligena]
MVSFVCNVCQETLKKNRLEQHFNRCYNAQYSCIDCSTDFYGTDYRQHTSCISEAEKYQKHIYQNKKVRATCNRLKVP